MGWMKTTRAVVDTAVVVAGVLLLLALALGALLWLNTVTWQDVLERWEAEKPAAVERVEPTRAEMLEGWDERVAEGPTPAESGSWHVRRYVTLTGNRARDEARSRERVCSFLLAYGSNPPSECR